MHEAVRGRIFDIQRFSIHDGPGIRTTVFLKGCPLRCVWCHNPEGIRPEPQISFASERCIGCGFCFRACRRNAHAMQQERHVLDRARCVACGACAAGCPTGALETVGREVSVDEILSEVLRDRPFYETSGGGLTVSGGEPLQQPAFAAALLAAARKAGVSTALETCGYADWESFEAVLGQADLFLFDYKETDPVAHAEYTGVSNERCMAHLERLHAAGARIILRCPLIPGLNDRAGHFDGIAALAQRLPHIERVELMPFHPLGAAKNERLGRADGPGPDPTVPGRDMLRCWREELARRGLNAAIHGLAMPL